ncbi:aldo-keto reductase AKR2E4-like [Pieris napi]|uniref:aldo-keto reductase AKR2E4-like n=1 Tax=Pieris napi TaxID=78633 RepID=UPI001FBBA54B|nr:aldo-keto reductase AKR2E4-like [Pieris napi]
MSPKVTKIKLNNGVELPMIGLGTYARKWDAGDVQQAVECGIDLGYRHIDTASVYKNEEEVGQGILNKIKNGNVSRNDLFITTKLWNNYHEENEVVPALKESLEKLKLDYVDLYLVHWPISINNNGEFKGIDYLETWSGMEQALQLGLTKAIGVSNFNEEQLDRLLKVAKIKPVVNQIEINPTLTQHKLVDFCKSSNVQAVAYTPLGLMSDARPEFAHLDRIKTDPKLGALAAKYGKTRAQIALRYLVQRGIVVIPKSFTKSRMEENMNIFEFELSDDEMALVDSFNIDHRCVPATSFAHHKYYPF